MRTRIRRRLIMAAIITAALITAAPSAAVAGTYTVSQCNDVTVSPWQPRGYQGALWTYGSNFLASPCTGNGGGLTLDTNNHQMAHGEQAGAWLDVANGATIKSVDFAYTTPAQAGPESSFFGLFSGATKLWDVSTKWGSSSNLVHVATPIGATGIKWRMACQVDGGPGTCDWSAAGYVAQLKGVTLTLDEQVDPTVSSSGTLTGAGPLHGTKGLQLDAQDDESGVKSMQATLGGTVVASRVNTCDPSKVTPCATSASQLFDVDTTQILDGSYLLRLTATDYAGNVKTTDVGYVEIDNVPPPVNTSLPVVSGETRLGRPALTASAGTWTGSGIAYSYRWQRLQSGSWQDIPGATTASHTVTTDDVGMRLRIRVRATNDQGTTDAYSDATEAVTAPGPTDADGDFDGDGLTNANDPDDDNDGTPDTEDPAPFDPSVKGNPAGGEGVSPIPNPTAGNPLVPTFQTKNGAGASPGATLVAVYSSTNRRSIKVRWGQRRKVTGTLLQPDGQPIVGASLEVVSQNQAMGAKPRRVGTLVTDARGRFLYVVGKGVSRTVTIGYRWYKEASTATHTQRLAISVIPKVGLKTSRRALRNGQAVKFTGTVAGAPRGLRKTVELQALDGRTWRTFATVRLARSGGKFSYTYRFRRTTRPTLYQFRALIRGDKGWPFLTGQSQTAKVRVRP